MFRLEVIDFIDQTGSAVVARVPASGTAAIQMGAQLIVQQNQEAVFFRDGRAMDVFGPGRHTLTTANIPILTSILTIPWQKSPFQACVYFVGKQRFVDQRWGTRQPITMKDPDFGMIRLRGFGKFSFRVVDSSVLINEIVGTQGMVTTDQVTDFLRDILVSGISDLMATANIGLLQLSSKFDEVAAAGRMKIGEEFKKFGLELTDLVISNISAPEEVQKAIDARSSMSAIGDLRSYTLYQAANGLSGSGGNNPAGSMAAVGMGAGMGAGMGMMLPSILQQALQQPGAATIAPAAASSPPASNAGSNAAGGRAANSIDEVKNLVRGLAKQSGWQVTENDVEWTLNVAMGPLRRQVVHVDFAGVDEAGHRIVSIWATCGQVDASNALNLLRYNAQIIHGAFAVQTVDGNNILVIRGNLLADTADLLEIMRTITAVAWQSSQAEQHLVG
ncbi:MAG: SPFH domain-containing protein [Pirellulales bacterium]